MEAITASRFTLFLLTKYAGNHLTANRYLSSRSMRVSRTRNLITSYPKESHREATKEAMIKTYRWIRAKYMSYRTSSNQVTLRWKS